LSNVAAVVHALEMNLLDSSTGIGGY
jgi:hypothetical protein